MKLVGIITLLALFGLATPANAAETALAWPRGDGRLALYNFHEDEFLEVTFRTGGRVDPAAIKKIEHLMRSHGDDAERPIDLRVLDLLDNIQDRFGAETVEIVSGYRSPRYNRTLSQEGRNVARESLHLQGLAADIHLDEVREEDLFAYAKGLGVGGAGLYPRYAFVHVDVGSPRSWQEAPLKERILVGTENNPNPAWAATTDKNIYAPGDTVTLAIASTGYGKQKLSTNVWFERFAKGKWSVHDRTGIETKTKALSSGESASVVWPLADDQPYGKYRLVIFASKDFSIPPAYSNEFYIKKNP